VVLIWAALDKSLLFNRVHVTPASFAENWLIRLADQIKITDSPIYAEDFTGVEHLSSNSLVSCPPLGFNTKNWERLAIYQERARTHRWLVNGGNRELHWVGNEVMADLPRDNFGWRSTLVGCVKPELFSLVFVPMHGYNDPRAFRIYKRLSIQSKDSRLPPHTASLTAQNLQGAQGNEDSSDPCKKQTDARQVLRRKQAREIAFRVIGGPAALLLGCLLIYHVDLRGRRGWRRLRGWLLGGLGALLVGGGLGAFFLPVYWQQEDCQHQGENPQSHNVKIVTQKHLTSCYLCNTVISMANVLSTDKQIGVISALAEGSSIRSIERMTGVHRDTIMRLGVKVGQGCAALMDAKMRDLSCTRLELDEIWGFVGKKDRNVRLNEPRPVGNVWTFCAIDADTKLVPAFKVGDRSVATAKAFVSDVASRMRNRVQISTDGLRAYVEAIESAFGTEVDFAQIVKTYGRAEVSDNRRYSAPEFVSSEKKVITGNPDERLISTSYVERLNATTRLHMRRLTRLTLAFSKKRENFEAAVGLHFAYYNFVKRHNTLRCTPAMAAGVEQGFWSVGDLVEAAA
jgi:IS1 family transposase